MTSSVNLADDLWQCAECEAQSRSRAFIISRQHPIISYLSQSIDNRWRTTRRTWKCNYSNSAFYEPVPALSVVRSRYSTSNCDRPIISFVPTTVSCHSPPFLSLYSPPVLRFSSIVESAVRFWSLKSAVYHQLSHFDRWNQLFYHWVFVVSALPAAGVPPVHLSTAAAL